MSNHRRQVKFSGLVNSGLLNPKPQAAPAHFASSLDEAAQPFEGAPASSDDSLANTRPATPDLINDEVREIAVTLVDDSPYQPAEESRDRYDPEAIDELAHTMAAAGQQEPIKVRWRNGRYELISGHRRIRAAKILGWENIKALIVIMDDSAAELSTLVHNEGRKDQCDYNKARMYRRAIERGYAKTQNEVAALFATKQTNVSRCQKMLSLPAEIKALLDAQPNLFSATTGEVILQLVHDFPDQVQLIKQAVERIKDGAPENSIKGWVSQKQSAQTQNARPRNNRPKVITDAGGRQIYTAKLTGRIIELRLSSPDIDADQALEKLIQHLKNDLGGETKENE